MAKQALHFSITATNDDLKRKLAESRQAILNSAKTAEAQASRIDGSFKRAALAAGAFFTVQQAASFAKQIAVVRGEFQQLEVAFTTMLGSTSAGKAMMQEAVEIAAKTPFDLKGVAQGAKQLLAYGSASRDVGKELVMLGNIAAGLSIPLNDMVYLYGTTQTQGRLFTQDLRQFMGRGIPLADELAKQFGVTKERVGELVTAGKVGFPEVQKALQAMTADGGKFNNLMAEQSKTITGQISNLGDSIDVMFNKIGTSQEELISDVIGGATSLVENYEKVGREIGALVVTYGAYKAAVISFAAVQKTVTTIKHTEEAVELAKLLTIEQQSNISKLGLAKTSAEYAAAVKSEVVAEMEKQTQLAVTTKAELEASQIRLASASDAKKQAEEIVAAKQAELTSIIGVAKAEQVVALEKKIAIESEKQSRAALLTTRLNQNKANAISSVQELQLQASLGAAAGKDVSAIKAKIAVKQKEIAIIAEKIAVSKAEEVQCSRNVVSLRAEKLAIDDSIASKATLKAQTAFETAQQELNTSSIARNAAAREVSSKRAAMDSAVRRANSLETGINTASQAANATATGFLSVAKLKLTAITAKLNAVIMANPYTIAAIAIAALAYGIYKLCTAQSAAEKAQEAFNEKIEESKKKQEEFVSKTNELIGVVRTETNTRYMQTKAFKELNDRYPDLLKNMSMEKLRLMDNLELQKLIAQYKENEDKKEIFTGLDDAQKKVEAAKKALSDYVAVSSRMQGGTSAFGEISLKNKIKEAEEYLKQWQNKLKEHRQIEADARPADVKIADLSQNITLLEDQLAEIQRLQDEAKKNNPYGWNLYEHQIGAINAQISAEQGKLKVLKEGNAAQTEQDKNKAYWETQKKNAQDAIEAMGEAKKNTKEWNAEVAKINQANSKLKLWDVSSQKTEAKNDSAKNYSEQIKKQLQERLRVEKDMELQLAQSKIDAKDEGLDKTLAQNKLNYDKEIEQIKRQREDRLAQIQEWERKEWEAKNPNHAKEGKTFIPTTTKLSDDQNALFDQQTTNAVANYVTANKNTLAQFKAQWQSWGDEYQQIEDKITKVKADAVEARNKIDAELKAGNINLHEASAARSAVDTGEENQIAGLESDKTKLTASWSSMFRDLQGMSRREVNKLIESINEELENKELSAADASALLEQLSKAKEYSVGLNPFAAWVDSLGDVKTATDAVETARQKVAQVNLSGSAKEKAEAEQALQDAQKLLASAKARRAESTSKSLSDISNIASSTSGLLKTFGVESPAVDGVIGSLSSLASIDFMNPISIITGGLDAISSLLGGIFGETDAAKQREIDKLQGQIEYLEESYDGLGEAIEKAYSSDASKLIHQSNEMLEKQNKLIEQQKEAEKSKKDPDNDALDEYDKKIEENNKKIEENKIKAQDAIFGADVKNAIDDFASAYANAWASGEDRAKAMKNVVKNMIKGIIVEMLKSDLAPTVQKIRDEIETMLIDGIIDDYEQSRLDSIIEEATSNADKKYDWADDYLKDDNAIENEKSKVGMITGAGLTEQTAGEFIGIQRGAADKLASINNKISVGIGHIVAIAKSNAAIEANTRATASHTAQTVTTLLSGFSAMQSELVAIKDNTSKDNGSYGG